MRFRYKIFKILIQYPQLNTKEIYDKYLESNPRDIPAMNRFAQMMKWKWFVNIGKVDEVKNNARNRYAVWEVAQEYREYPPKWPLVTMQIVHHGGKENYEKDDFVIDSCSSF